MRNSWNILTFMFWAWKITNRWLYAWMLSAFLGGCAYPLIQQTATEAPAGREEVQILLYHHIEDAPATITAAQHRWYVSPQKFAAQMDWLAAQGFHPITMTELIAHKKNNDALPSNPIVITFDDGWKDNYSVVLPILKKHAFMATFFVITVSIGHSAYMDWEEVQTLSAAGMDVEPHSDTHPMLTRLSHKEARREIVDSKSILESRLNKQTSVFAYPYGDYNNAVISMVKDAGFEAAVAVSGMKKAYVSRTDPLYTLMRYAVEDGDGLEDVARLKGFYPR